MTKPQSLLPSALRARSEYAELSGGPTPLDKNGGESLMIAVPHFRMPQPPLSACRSKEHAAPSEVCGGCRRHTGIRSIQLLAKLWD